MREVKLGTVLHYATGCVYVAYHVIHEDIQSEWIDLYRVPVKNSPSVSIKISSFYNLLKENIYVGI